MFLHTGAELYGADQMLYNIVTNLDTKIFAPIVVLPNTGPLADKLRETGIRIEIIPYPIIRRKYFNIKGIISFLRSYIRDSKKLYELAKKEQVDIVHNNTMAVLEGIYLKKKLKVKLISHVHEMLEDPKIVAKFLYGVHLKHCDKMIAVSEAVKKHIENILHKTNNKILVVHNGIPAAKNTQVGAHLHKFYKELGLPKSAKIAAFVGRINAIKGHNDFVEAMRQVIVQNQNAYGLIFGDAFDGQEWRVNDLKQTIKGKKMDKHIIYCGFRNDVEKLYPTFSLLVLSSVKPDSFPTVVLEAMASGVPTVAYKCGGVEEMIKDGYNGYIVEQGNINGLGIKISKILDNDDVAKIARENAKQYFAENFTLEKFISTLSAQYKEVLR